MLHFVPRDVNNTLSRQIQGGAYWIPLDNDASLETYARFLHSFLHAVLTSLHGHHSKWKFPLTFDDIVRGDLLLKLLDDLDEDKMTTAAVDGLHTFLKPFLYPRNLDNDTGDSNKWDDVFECVIAIYALQDNSSFKVAKDVTQIFAIMHYHVRGAILYQGHRNLAQFSNNLYK